MYAELRDVIKTAHQRMMAIEEHLADAGDSYWAGQAQQAGELLRPLLSSEIACCHLQMAQDEIQRMVDAAELVKQRVKTDPFKQSVPPVPAPDADDHL